VIEMSELIGGEVMKFGVTHKLFMLILMAAGLAVVSSALIMQWSFSRGFLKFVNTMEQSGRARLAAKLEDNYRTEKNWQFLKRDPERWGQLVGASLPEATPPPREKPLSSSPLGGSSDHHPLPLPPHIIRQFDQRLFLLDADRKVLVSHGDTPIDTAATPLLYQGSIVGYLGLLPRTKISDAPQKRFLREQTLAFSLVAGVIVLLSALLSLLLAKRLVRPLKELTHATHQLAAGSFAVRVSVESHDELGQLARDFNALALTLNQSEVTRRQC
jgi:two-component system sensor histidine kinase BaeS